MQMLPASVVTLLLLVPAAAAQVTPGYTLTRVNPVGEDGISIGAGLSDTGFLTAAASSNPAPSVSAFAWTVGGHGLSSVAVTLPTPAGVTWGDSVGFGINAAGVAVGQFSEAPIFLPLSRGFRFQSGVSVELFGPEGTPGLPTAINRDGWIVGSTVTASGTRAVLWSPTLVASYLDPLVRAHDINDVRAVLGSLGTGAAERAAILQDGVLTELGDLDPFANPVVQAAALNNLGHAVGRTRLGGREVAFRWTPTTGMTQLASFASPQGGSDLARDISDSGFVVGGASDLGGTEPVLWTPANELLPLRDLTAPPSASLAVTGAYRINSAGQIAVWAIRSLHFSWAILTPAVLEAVALAPAVAGALYEVDVTGARPGKTVFLVGDVYDPEERGYRALPGGPLGLSMPAPRFAARATADAAGHARLVWNVPSSAAGMTLRLQAFQVAPTRVSALLVESP